MPSFVNPEKCDGCKALDKTACQYICPNDLMSLDRDKMKAFNREPEMCWECYSCVKICPQAAIDVRGYADFVPMGGSVVPMRTADSITWTVKFRNGMVKRFKFPVRSTPEGKAEPSGGFASQPTLDGVSLFTEPASLGLPQVWTIERKA